MWYSSYRYELLNLCWYCWGGGFFPFRLSSCRIPSENMPWAVGNTCHKDAICCVTSPIRGCEPYQSFQSSIFVSTEEESIKLFSCLQFLFLSTNSDFIRHINTFFNQIHKSRHIYKFLYINQNGKSLFFMIRIVSQ